MRLRTSAAASATGLAALLAGCGSHSSAQHTTASSPGVPRGSVAVVAGTAITRPTFHHWLAIAAKAQTSQNQVSGAAGTLLPVDPPDFAACVAQFRKQAPTLAEVSPAQLKAECRQQFKTEAPPVMDFLIKARWYLAEAARQHITITSTQVQQAFRTEQEKRFHTAPAYARFLRQTGQTSADVLYRFRTSLAYQALVKAGGDSQAVDASIQARYRPQTKCAPYYQVTADCG